MDLELELFLLDQKSHDPQRTSSVPQGQTGSGSRGGRIPGGVPGESFLVVPADRDQKQDVIPVRTNSEPQQLQNRSATQTPLNSPHSPPAARHSGSEPDPNSELPGSALQDMCGFVPAAEPRSQRRAEPNRAERFKERGGPPCPRTAAGARSQQTKTKY